MDSVAEIKKRLAEIRKRCDEASTAPWKASSGDLKDWLVCTGNSSIDGEDWHVTTDHVRVSELYGDAKTDAEFIANARQDIPFLLETVDALLASERSREWVKVSDPDPMEAGEYLVVVEIAKDGATMKRVDIGYFCPSRGWRLSFNPAVIAKVIKWQPLPPLPSETQTREEEDK